MDAVSAWPFNPQFRRPLVEWIQLPESEARIMLDRYLERDPLEFDARHMRLELGN